MKDTPTEKLIRIGPVLFTTWWHLIRPHINPPGCGIRCAFCFVMAFCKFGRTAVKTVNVTIADSTWNTLFEASKFSSSIGTIFGDFEGFAEARSGHIGLQDHSDPVAFKNIKILELQ